MNVGAILNIQPYRNDDFESITKLLFTCHDSEALEYNDKGCIDVKLPFTNFLGKALEPILGTHIESELYAYLKSKYGVSITRYNDVKWGNRYGYVYDGARLHITKDIKNN